jgi:hypothetical protein
MKNLEVEMLILNVVGLPYYGYEKLKDSIKLNDFLKLIPEPENKFDKNAIAVYWNDTKIGHIAAQETQYVKHIKKHRYRLSCISNTYLHVQEEDDPEYKIMIKVWSENKINKLIKNNDEFIIRILIKLSEFDLLKYNDFLFSVNNFYKERMFLSKKQISELRKIFLLYSDIITKMANNDYFC